MCTQVASIIYVLCCGDHSSVWLQKTWALLSERSQRVQLLLLMPLVKSWLWWGNGLDESCKRCRDEHEQGERGRGLLFILSLYSCPAVFTANHMMPLPLENRIFYGSALQVRESRCWIVLLDNNIKYRQLNLLLLLLLGIPHCLFGSWPAAPCPASFQRVSSVWQQLLPPPILWKKLVSPWRVGSVRLFLNRRRRLRPASTNSFARRGSRPPPPPPPPTSCFSPSHSGNRFSHCYIVTDSRHPCVRHGSPLSRERKKKSPSSPFFLIWPFNNVAVVVKQFFQSKCLWASQWIPIAHTAGVRLASSLFIAWKV